MATDECLVKPSVVMLTADRKIDRRILLQADSLQAAGWGVTIIAMPAEPGYVDTDPRIIRASAIDRKSHNENRYLQIYQWLRNWLPKNNVLINGIKKIIWGYFVNQKDFYSRYFAKPISNLKPTVYMAHDLPMLPIAAMAATRCGAKLIYDSHELYCEQELSIYEKKYWKKLERKYIQDCSAVITVNNSIAKIMKEIYHLPEVHVIYNSERNISIEKKHGKTFHQIFGFSPQRKILLFQGNLSAGRNIETLIQAMHRVTNPLVCLVILGEGPLSLTLHRQIKKLNLSDRVFLHSAVPQYELIELTASADAGIIPYQASCLNNYYCTPNKLFEFITAGIPILANDLPEIRKIVMENNIGLIGNMNSAKSIAKLIDSFFSDATQLEEWRARVLTARQEICWENESKKLILIYKSLQYLT